LQFLKSGLEVYGFDTDFAKIEQLNKKKSYLTNVAKKDIKKYINKNFFVFNTFEKIKEVDYIIICLPTPLKKKNLPD
jgi:UDP-N-acetyl-D-glucosamine dehydrogenase